MTPISLTSIFRYVLFFDSKGPIYQVKIIDYSIRYHESQCRIFQHFVPKGTTVNTDTYLAVLTKFNQLHRHKRPERFGEFGTAWGAEEWWFHQDNAPAHKSGLTMEWIEMEGWNVLTHSPYSPDLAVRNVCCR